MSYVNIENATEEMLKDAFQDALDTAELSATVRGWWLDDDTGASSEDEIFPQVNIKAAPNYGYEGGYRQPLRLVPVTVDCITFAADDPKRQDVQALYHAIREVLDEDTFSHDSFSSVPAIEINRGGDVFLDEGVLNVIRTELTVHVCLGPQ